MSGKIQLDISPSPSRSRQKMIFVQTEIKGNRIIIEFSDTGPGIHQNDLQYIFDPFYTRKRTMGMGIGLSICCGIIEDHNGTITAENLPDAGARFVIILPVESPQECLNES
jgi:signal transduction histidine kinase